MGFGSSRSLNLPQRAGLPLSSPTTLLTNSQSEIDKDVSGPQSFPPETPSLALSDFSDSLLQPRFVAPSFFRAIGRRLASHSGIPVLKFYQPREQSFSRSLPRTSLTSQVETSQKTLSRAILSDAPGFAQIEPNTDASLPNSKDNPIRSESSAKNSPVIAKSESPEPSPMVALEQDNLFDLKKPAEPNKTSFQNVASEFTTNGSRSLGSLLPQLSILLNATTPSIPLSQTEAILFHDWLSTFGSEELINLLQDSLFFQIEDLNSWVTSLKNKIQEQPRARDESNRESEQKLSNATRQALEHKLILISATLSRYERQALISARDAAMLFDFAQIAFASAAEFESWNTLTETSSANLKVTLFNVNVFKSAILPNFVDLRAALFEASASASPSDDFGSFFQPVQPTAQTNPDSDGNEGDSSQEQNQN